MGPLKLSKHDLYFTFPELKGPISKTFKLLKVLIRAVHVCCVEYDCIAAHLHSFTFRTIYVYSIQVYIT